MVRFLVLLLGILPAIASAYFAAPSICFGPIHPWVSGCYGYPPARSYCSKQFPQKTTTRTITAPTRTLTSTVATSTAISTLPGTITSVVGLAPETIVTVYTTVYTTSTGTITATSSTTSTSTSTVTITSTSTVRSAPTVVKRDLPTGAPAFKELLLKGRPIIEKVCSCIVTSQVTATFTTTPSTTVRVTAVTTHLVSNVVSTTLTPTVTTTSTVTAAAAPETITTTTVSTATEVTTTTATTVATVAPQPPKCNPNSQFGQRGSGGCSTNCYCDRDIDGVNFYCDSSIFCLGGCQSDADCAADQFCATGTSCSSTNGRTCQKYSDCTSTFVPPGGGGLRRNAGLEAVAAVERMPARAVQDGVQELSHKINH
ncbi:hypothetical protein PFICI_11093 [Pestalotiopsis fici W106-1]|uniref:Uncharacterized protein n=1 Tax=Pestalotiopsis fici (strain W106-1 / CGMCC3.15140) TaxID=1229662 RepID=W3WTV6_PESFW|nr:uncharacterized protein PFICI_11093 [Pestalotiopsis fici W106-1]ETS77219.1 hypothetical protein PFICI_11093 [Pestalotiopsis fici W106-1]